MYNSGFSNAFAAFCITNQASFNLSEVWWLSSLGTMLKLGETVNTHIAVSLVALGSATDHTRSFQLVH
jgi:hypothetical protein